MNYFQKCKMYHIRTKNCFALHKKCHILPLLPICISLTRKGGNLRNMEKSQEKFKKYTPTCRVS